MHTNTLLHSHVLHNGGSKNIQQNHVQTAYVHTYICMQYVYVATEEKMPAKKPVQQYHDLWKSIIYGLE